MSCEKKYVNEEKEQNRETDNPNVQVGFSEFLQKGKHEEDNSSQELDNFDLLKELKLLFNILQDEEFRRSREVLAAK